MVKFATFPIFLCVDFLFATKSNGIFYLINLPIYLTKEFSLDDTLCLFYRFCKVRVGLDSTELM